MHETAGVNGVGVSPRDEIVKAYYSSVIATGQVARNRAQVGFTIASAVTVALGASGILAGVDERSTGVAVLGAVALACWFAASFAFLFAVSSPVKLPNKGEFDSHSVSDVLLDNAEHERDCIQRRQGAAQVLVALALIATFTTVCLLDVFPDERLGTSPARASCSTEEGRGLLAD